MNKINIYKDKLYNTYKNNKNIIMNIIGMVVIKRRLDGGIIANNASIYKIF